MNESNAPHPSDRTLTSFGVGDLEPAVARAIKRHLAACDDCRRRLKALSPKKPTDEPARSASEPGPTADEILPPSTASSSGLSADQILLIDLEAKNQREIPKRRRRRIAIYREAAGFGLAAILGIIWILKSGAGQHPAPTVQNAAVAVAVSSPDPATSQADPLLPNTPEAEHAETLPEPKASKPVGNPPNRDKDNRPSRIKREIVAGEAEETSIKTSSIAAPTIVEDEPFFNQKDLSGWEAEPGIWRVDQGKIVGTMPAGKPAHAAIFTKRKFKDFDLRFKARVTGSLAAGLQFRSQASDAAARIVAGPQCILRGDKGSPAGGLRTYPTGKPEDTARATQFSKFVKEGDFNHFQIRCEGPRVIIKVNGRTTVNAEPTSLPAEGVIAWQLDGTQPPGELIVKDITFADLSASKRSGESERSILQDFALLKAESQYTAALDKANNDLLKKFDRELQKLRSGKTPVGEYAATAETVQSEKEAFQRAGWIPWSKPMRKPLKEYLTTLIKTQEQLGNEVNKAMKRAESRPGGKGEGVAELAADLLAPRVLAVWNRPAGPLLLNSDQSCVVEKDRDNDREGYWAMDEEAVAVFLPNADNEDFMMIKCDMAPNGKAFEAHFPNGSKAKWSLADAPASDR
jgi:hypothetical protein